MSPRTSRRALLGTVGTAALVGSAGCISVFDGGSGATDDTISLPSVVTDDDLPDGSVPLVPDGRVALVNFFATWCRPCQKEMPVFRELRAEYDSDALHMVSVTPQAEDDLIRQFWDRYDGTWPVVKDTGLEATAKYDANAYPTNLLFDRNGEPANGGDSEINVRSFDGLTSKIEPLLQ